ncbi:MAG: hypothetical protein LBS63_04930 [Prevotellaceae bacterium]|jgi:hypothetical protein|nr:hypothetical protein [Prevotellaceae bacterium]
MEKEQNDPKKDGDFDISFHYQGSTNPSAKGGASEKEISLEDIIGKSKFVFVQIGLLFKWLLHLVEWLLHLVEWLFLFGVRKSLWFIGFVFVGFIVSYATYKAAKPAYSSLMVTRMNVLDNAFAIKFINELGTSAHDSAEWNQLLSLPDTMGKHVVSINAYWGVDYNGDGIMDFIDFKRTFNRPRTTFEDTTYVLLTDVFYIQALVYNIDVLPYISQAIVEKINNNPHVLKQNAVRKAQTQAKIDEINHQIKLLDSLQRYEYFIKPGKHDSKSNNSYSTQIQGQLMVFTEKEQRLYHNDVLQLYTARLELERQLEFQEPMTVIRDINSSTLLETNFTSYATKGIIVSFSLALLWALLWDNRKWLTKKIVEPS